MNIVELKQLSIIGYVMKIFINVEPFYTLINYFY